MNEPPLLDSSNVTPAQPGARSGERLRWGLTGLAAIFLIVMAAAAGLRPNGRQAKPSTGEPLAVLGVAPGPATRPAQAQ